MPGNRTQNRQRSAIGAVAAILFVATFGFLSGRSPSIPSALESPPTEVSLSELQSARGVVIVDERPPRRLGSLDDEIDIVTDTTTPANSDLPQRASYLLIPKLMPSGGGKHLFSSSIHKQSNDGTKTSNGGEQASSDKRLSSSKFNSMRRLEAR